MTDENLPVQVFQTHHAEVTALKGKSTRVDVYVGSELPDIPTERPDWVQAFRTFLDRMDQETDRYAQDPIATSQALARMEAILADMRYVRDRLRDVTADSMNRYGIRRLTVQGVSVAEASSSVQRSNWQHADLVWEMLERLGVAEVMLNQATGEMVPVREYVTETIAALYGPSTSPRITPVKEAGLRVEDYCEMEYEEDGVTPARTPTVRLMDNSVRKNR